MHHIDDGRDAGCRLSEAMPDGDVFHAAANLMKRMRLDIGSRRGTPISSGVRTWYEPWWVVCSPNPSSRDRPIGVAGVPRTRCCPGTR
jgi:hypothetical protein